MQTNACATELLCSADVACEANRRGDSLTAAGVRLAAASQRLRVAAVTPRGQRLFAREEVERYLAERARRRGAEAA